MQGPGGGPSCGVTAGPTAYRTHVHWVLAGGHPALSGRVLLRCCAGRPVGLCSACQCHFVDGFTRLSKALRKALFKKTAQPFVKVPLNYSPK